jgi:adenylosuccinate synthase
MAAAIVTDLGYGDAGKGTTVDFLARQMNTLVVRHCGGPQAGHNVVTPDGQHHTFAQFGSGTLAGAKTFLSRFMLVNPLNMMREAGHLVELGQLDVWDRTYVDKAAIVITPWHASLNRMEAAARGSSCGQGIGVAQKQNIEHPELTIRVKDLLDPRLSQKLDNQRRYLLALGMAQEPTDWASRQAAGVMLDEDLADDLARSYRDWARLPQLVGSEDLDALMSVHAQTVFEGSQGVLLDEWYGFHPYTTWSTTTHTNALTLLREAGYSGPLTRYGVTRAYMVRHGAGPFPTGASSDLRFSEPHNLTGAWQGAFRQGHLDVSALRYAADVCGGIDRLVVTHTDRASSWFYCDSYTLHALPGEPNLDFQQVLTNQLMSGVHKVSYEQVNTPGLLAVLGERIAPVGLVSYGPTSDDKKVTAEMELEAK